MSVTFLKIVLIQQNIPIYSSFIAGFVSFFKAFFIIWSILLKEGYRNVIITSLCGKQIYQREIVIFNLKLFYNIKDT